MADSWREIRGVLHMGIGLCVVAAVVLWLSLPPMLAGHALHRDAPGFVVTPCTHVRVGTMHYRHSYEPMLFCTYEVDGTQREIDSDGSELDFAFYQTRDGALAAAKQRMHAVPQHAFYDPLDPTRAAMSRDTRYSDAFWVFVVLAVFAGLLGIASLIAFAIRARRFTQPERRERADFPSATVIRPK